MTRHRLNRHRMSPESSKSLAYSALPDKIFWEQKADSYKFSRELFCSTPKPLVRRETRPPFEDRSVDQQSYEPHPHSKRRHRRGKRSLLQKLIHTCNRHQKRSENRKEFRRVRSCWKALARLPAKLSLAQERILAETQSIESSNAVLQNGDVQENEPNNPPQNNSPCKILGKTTSPGGFSMSVG